MEFTVGTALSFGWETFKKRPWFFIGTSVLIAIAYFVVGGVTTAIDAALGGSSQDPTLIGAVVDIGLSTLVGMGAIAFYLAAHDNPDTVELSALWHPRPFWKFLGASILTGIIVGIGFVLLVVPGIIALLFFMFTTLIVIDRGSGPIAAMQESMAIGRGYRWPLLGLIVLLILILIVGGLALLVGLLVAMPVTSLAFVHAYRVLSAKAGLAPAAADARLGT